MAFKNCLENWVSLCFFLLEKNRNSFNDRIQLNNKLFSWDNLTLFCEITA